VYETTNRKYIGQLERRIMQYISEKIEKHRFEAKSGELPTSWNKKYGDQMKKALYELFESFRYHMRSIGANEADKTKIATDAVKILECIKDQFGRDLNGKESYGFPLNMPYVSIEQIWEEVRNTEIHNILNNDVDFALAVAITAYPNYVLSVWVYIGIIQK
jgi:hypothetical protein